MPVVGKQGSGAASRTMGVCYREYMHRKDKADGTPNKYPKCVFGKACKFCHKTEPDQETLKKWEESPPLPHDRLLNPPKLVAAPAKGRQQGGRRPPSASRSPSSSGSDRSGRSSRRTGSSESSASSRSTASSRSSSKSSRANGRRGKDHKGKGSPARGDRGGQGRRDGRRDSRSRGRGRKE